MSADIVLATLNARYSHASFGLRCLRASLGEYRSRSVIVEGNLETRPLAFVERLLSESPRLIGLGVYVWNARLSREVVALLKRIAPDVIVVVGGPEVSHEVESQAICDLADHVVRGEGETAFYDLCRRRLDPKPLDTANAKVIDGGSPDLDVLPLPYDEYVDEDLARRTVYVEASRGCPFRCAFCLSALDKRVRPFPMPAFLDALDGLYRRGLRRFKFVDRTFNLAIQDALSILRFFEERRPEELFLHFEMIPDRLPPELLEALRRFPNGAIQLEVGLQTFNEEVAKTIQRRTDFEVAVTNIKRLRAETGVHVHADLIAGLPGETWASFAAGFDRLVDAGPQEIQLGILKRLRGAPITAIPEASSLVYEDEAPYEVLRTDALSFEELMALRRAARVWDSVFNQGRFPRCSSLLLSAWRGQGSVFAGLARFSEHVFDDEGALHGIGLLNWLAHVHSAMLAAGIDPDVANEAARADYCGDGQRRVPPFLSQGQGSRDAPKSAEASPREGPPPRQRRHLEHPG